MLQNSKDPVYLAKKKAELLDTANAMLAGRMHLIEGVRRICFLRFETDDPENKAFIAFRGVDSETDNFPLGAVRLNWNPDALKRKDEEMERYLTDAKDEILQACLEIVRKYS